MCKLLIILVLGASCIGCASSKSPSHAYVAPTTQKTFNPIISKAKFKGCRKLKNGYLVCPKIARK